MAELFEYILIALACPLVLPMVEPQERSNHEQKPKMPGLPS